MSEVRVWQPAKRKLPSGKVSYRLRWTLDGVERCKSYPTKAQALSARSKLLAAADAGETFDVLTGLPSRTRSVVVVDVARAMLAEAWPGLAAKSRGSLCDALARLLPGLVLPGGIPPSREEIRNALRPDTPEGDAVRTLRQVGLEVCEIDMRAARAALDVANLREDGQRVSAAAAQRHRAALSRLLGYAVDRGNLATNPVRDLPQSRAVPPKPTGTQVGDLGTACRIIDAVPDPLMRSLLSVVLLAGLRPSEAVALRKGDLVLPEQGWGELVVCRSAAQAGKRWTDSGEARDLRGLKHRHAEDERRVPAHPDLVDILRPLPAGELFAVDGVLFSQDRIAKAWRKARAAVLPEASRTLPRVYDLRHLHISLMLNAGLPVTEVAARAGHSPAVCLEVYAHLVVSERAKWNAASHSALALPRVEKSALGGAEL